MSFFQLVTLDDKTIAWINSIWSKCQLDIFDRYVICILTDIATIVTVPKIDQNLGLSYLWRVVFNWSDGQKYSANTISTKWTWMYHEVDKTEVQFGA